MLAFGVGQWPHGPSGAFGGWTSLLLVLVSLSLIRFVVRLPVTWPAVFVAIAAGTVWGYLIELWGFLPPAALALLLVLAASWTADRIRDAAV